ncbi:MAG TPA: von Willebrand factor type A domain-containing protein [Planctomycetota bacterium]|nr:von Willebrand factor type A domain-containing protein [Planctomycetota bacterium]
MTASTKKTESDEHLGYLLTAYVFDSLSSAGRQEVQEHLSSCAECREQLSLLLKTLGAAEEALSEGNKEYVFEERRRQRVLEAARRARPNVVRRIRWSWKYSALVAALMIAVLIGLSLQTMSSPRMAAGQTAPAGAAKAYAEADDFYQRRDYDANRVVEYSARSKSTATGKPSLLESKVDSQAYGLVPQKPAPSAPPPAVALPAPATAAPAQTAPAAEAAGVIAGDASGSVTFNSVATQPVYKVEKLNRKIPAESPVAQSAPPAATATEAAPAKPTLGYSIAGVPVNPPATNDAFVINNNGTVPQNGAGAGPSNSPVPVAEPARRPAVAGVALQDAKFKEVAEPTIDFGVQDSRSALSLNTLPEPRLPGEPNRPEPKTLAKKKGTVVSEEAVEFSDAPIERVQEKKVAIAAKDAEIKNRRELIEQERAEKANLHDFNQQLARQNKTIEELSDLPALAKALKNASTPAEPALTKELNQQTAVAEQRQGIEGAAPLQHLDGLKRDETAKALGAVSDPISREIDAIVVPPDILAKAELGDHFETLKAEDQITRVKRRTTQAEIEERQLANSPGTPGSGGSWGGGSGGGLGKDGKAQAIRKIDLGNTDPAKLENLLRGYRYFAAGNPRLTFAEFLRRPAPVPPVAPTDEGLDEDAYIEKYGTRPFVDCARDHLSTFGLDVDTASYTLARSRLNQNQLPDPEAVRVEEFLNYFKQRYTVAGDDAFGVFAEGAPSPFASAQRGTQILKIGIKSREPRADERKPAMLTFVIDTSGSMTRDDRLVLVRAALKSLVEQLNAEDAVCIVGFSDQAELLLPRTQARQKQRILDAIDALTTRGSTNVEAGLTMGYRLADEAFSPDAVNRVILCSDGVANVGAKGPEEILKLVKLFAGRGIDLCAVGFGMGQYNDQMMMKLANNGNGSCHFVDSVAEAQKIFREQLPPNLNVLARDAKAQVEFNPEVVERYRLLGYEKRKIADKDFRNDKIDAGEVAHSTLITVLYEIVRKPGGHGPLGKVFLRWKDAGYRHLPVVERNYPLSEGILAASAQGASPELRFLACVARFAELLRQSKWAQDSSYAAVLEQLDQLPSEFQSRSDFAELRGLVQRAQELTLKSWLAGLR